MPADWAEAFGGLGVDAALGNRLLAWSVGRAARDLTALPGVKKEKLAALAAATAHAPLALRERSEAPDGFVKYLFGLHDGLSVEAVRIPVPCEAPGADTSAYDGKEKKWIVCVSSQAGCALACAFCATGALGFRRNLEAWEIVEQVLAVRAEGGRPVRGIVFMGMGEPFLNYEQVIRAARILSHPSGGAIDARAITVSTAGIVPQLRRFTAEGHKYRLAVSLTQADPRKRLPLMPIEQVHSTAELVAALHDHARARRTRVLVEYVLLGGVNDAPEDAEALCGLLDRALVKVDLIDVNGGVGGFARATPARRSAFLDVLARRGMPFGIRYSGGQAVEGGCGMLAAGLGAEPAGAKLRLPLLASGSP